MSGIEQKKKLRILVVSQYFYPEQFRINDIVSEWVNRGYEVTVLTGIPNYPQGKFYKGYSWFKKRREKWNGVNIVRIPLIARGSTAIGMVLNYVSFAISGWFWSKFTKFDADLVFSFGLSPITQVLPGCWFAKKKRTPHYLYVQDLWPENLEAVTGVTTPLVITPIDKMVCYIYKRCTKIFTTSPSFVKEIQKKVSDKNTVFYWPQYAEDFYRPVEAAHIKEIPTNSSLKVVFTGNIGYAQGLDVLPKVARILKDEDVQFVVVGDGRYREELEKEIADVADKFILIGSQPPQMIPKILSVCDIAFISFMDTELFSMTIPAKLQSYMACAMPILAAAQGETARIINDADCGVCCPIGDEKAIANSILMLKNSDLTAMSENSRKYFEKHFDKKKLMDEMDMTFKGESIPLDSVLQ